MAEKMNQKKKKPLALALGILLLLGHAGGLMAADTPEAAPAPAGGYLPVAAGGTGSLRLPSSPADNILITGILTRLDNGLLQLTSEGENGSYQEIQLVVTDTTVIMDGVSGQPGTTINLKNKEKVYAYLSAPDASNLPPLVIAQVILYGVTADGDLPGYFEIRRFAASEGAAAGAAALRLVTDKDMVLQVGDTCLIEAYSAAPEPTLQEAAASRLIPGARVLVWYPAILLSMPAQTSPTRIIALPYAYNGYVELTPEGGLYVNGQPLAPDAGMTVYQNEQGFTMLPLRKVYETLGYTVAWDETSASVILWYDGAREFGFLFDLAHADKIEELGGIVTSSVADIEVTADVTFVSVDDLVRLSNVLFARRS
jgi:hypothetical protein